MNSVSYDVTRLPSVLTVGRQTETGVMAVRIDCTGWLTFWPGLTLRLFVTAPGGAAAYPAQTHMEGSVLVWDVNSADTVTVGRGALEVVGEAPGMRKLSAIAGTNVLHTITATTAEPPEQIKTWFEEVTEAAAIASAAMADVATATAKANAAADEANEAAREVTAEIETLVVTQRSANRCDESAMSTGRYTVVNNGVTAPAFVDDAARDMTDYIPVEDKTYLIVAVRHLTSGNMMTQANGVVGFDADKNPIGNLGTTTAAVELATAFPGEVSYVRVYWTRASFGGDYFVGFSNEATFAGYEKYYPDFKSMYGVTTDADTRLDKLLGTSKAQRVVCWGDSLTAGAGASGANYRYVNVLTNLLSEKNTVSVENCGIPGENSFQIAARQGGVVMKVKPVTIPASGSVVVEMEKWHGREIQLLRAAGTYVTEDRVTMKLNPCSIGGVMGTLLRNTTGQYVFTRSEDGNEVVLSRPVPLITSGATSYNEDGDVAVIWVGTNNTSDDAETIINTIKLMIDKLSNKQYIVVGITSKASHSDVEDKVFKEALTFGEHFLDLREYMLSYGLADAGIEATEQDTTDIANGEIPTSLRKDEVHFNDYGHDIVARQVYAKGQSLGYWL